MNAEQKRAWLGVLAGGVSILGFLILLPFFGPSIATAAFAFTAFYALAGLIGRGEKMDERDLAIAKRATLAGAMLSYMAFIIGCMGTWFIAFGYYRHEQIDVHLLGTITFLGGVVLMLARSIAVLWYYGRPGEADNA